MSEKKQKIKKTISQKRLKQSKKKTTKKKPQEKKDDCIEVEKVDPQKLLMLDFLQFLEDEMGIVKYACARANISRTTYYNWREVEDNAWFKDEADRIIGLMVHEYNDIVERKLFKIIDKGHPAGIIFYLKTRHPNYKPKSEMTFPGGLTHKIDLTVEDRELIDKALDYGFGFDKAKNKNKSRVSQKSCAK